MCGIFGYVGTRDDAAQLVLAGLKKLEYRGYDSWGIAARQNGSARAPLLVEKHTGKIGQATTSLPATGKMVGSNPKMVRVFVLTSRGLPMLTSIPDPA